jgi:integrase
MGAVKENDQADLNAILRDYLRQELEGDATGSLPLTFMALPTLQHRLAKARDALAKRDLGQVQRDVSRLAEAHDIPPEERYRLGIGILEAQVRAHEEAIRRAQGEASAVFTEPDEPIPPHYRQPEPPAAPPAAPGVQSASPETLQCPAAPEATASVPLASELVGPFLNHECPDDPETGVRNQTRNQTEASIRLFIKAMGDRPINAYGPADGLDYLAKLRQLPNDHHKLGRGDEDRSIDEVVERGKQQGKDRLALRSLQRHGQVLTSFMEFAYRRGLVEARMREITEGWRLPKKKVAAHAERRAWKPDQLKALLALPIWRGCKSRMRRLEPGTLLVRDWKFWLPLLGLYQGARLEEVCQLRREDVRRDPETGIWYLDINDRDGRQLKNPQSARLLPLHPEIIRMGFVRDVMAVTKKPSDRVFPDLKPIGPDRKLSYYPTRWFGDVRKKCGVGSEVDFHSFRHTANSRLLIAGVAPFVVARLLGRIYEAGGETTNRYFEGEMRQLHDALARLSYPEVDLSHLYVEDAPGMP